MCPSLDEPVSLQFMGMENKAQGLPIVRRLISQRHTLREAGTPRDRAPIVPARPLVGAKRAFPEPPEWGHLTETKDILLQAPTFPAPRSPRETEQLLEICVQYR